MHYNKAFLKFRFRQAGKIVREIPVPYLLVIGGMLVLLVYALYEYTQKLTGASLTGGLFLLLIGGVHFRRGDYHFIRLADEQPERIYCMDYWLLAIPVCILEIIGGYYWIAVLIGAGCWLISRIKQPARQTGNGTPPPRFIPKEAFELRAGIRKNGMLLLVVYGCGYATAWLPYVSFAFLWLSTCFTADLFSQAEPRQMLCIKELPANLFLLRKLKVYIRLYLLLMGPVCLFYTLLHPADWILSVVFIVLGVMNISLMIVSKYAGYEPNTKIRAGQVGIGFSLLGIILPFLAPLTLCLLLKKYPAAISNLKPYLYAYN